MSKRIGDEIKDIVQNAVNTRDFRQLNKDIGDTVNHALDEARNALLYPRNRQNWRDSDHNYEGSEDRNNSFADREDDHKRHSRYDRQDRYHNWNQRNQSYSYTNKDNQAVISQTPKQQTSLVPNVAVGKVSGILLTVFGSIGFGLSTIAAFTLCLIGQITGEFLLFGSIALEILPIFFISLILLIRGSYLRKRVRRFKRYLGIFKSRSYYSIKELSSNTGQSNKFVLKDLRKMISIGMFPEGHIDEQQTCLILNRESYHQYLELQKNLRLQKANVQEINKTVEMPEPVQETKQTSPEDTVMDPELKAAIESGRACIRQINEANEAIPGEDISKKLYHLEEIIERIFNYVEVHPEQIPQIQKFMDYYLPTTLKLVNTYKDFDKQSVQGENITSAKNEIERTLDTINLAFEKLFDNLFLNAAMDVSTDISVLETLLAQEGLTQKDFKTNLSMGGLTNE